MVDLTSTERLQPSLLDRLTDLEPEQKVEARDKRVLSLQKLRECVRRDLALLLNTINLAAVTDLEGYPEVARSTLNFGIPDLAGLSSGSIDGAVLERAVKQAIVAFEPRIRAATLKVRVETRPGEMNHNALTFYIDGQMWAQPSPVAMYLETVVDLQTGGVAITERTR